MPSPRRVLASVAAALVGAGIAVAVTVIRGGDLAVPAGHSAPSAELEEARVRLADLERELAALRADAARPTLPAREAPLPSTSPPPETRSTREARPPVNRPSKPPPKEQPPPSKPFVESRPWVEALRGVAAPRDGHPAVAEIHAALSGQDGVAAEAALIALGEIDVTGLDRATWRGLLEPYARSANFEVRRRGATLLHRIDPRPDDVERAIAAVNAATRFEAEFAVEDLVRMADGVVEGTVAATVLHVLRDGTEIVRAGVVRGVAQGDFVRLDRRVVDRMVEIASGVRPWDYECMYFFHFVAPRLEPRPRNVVDLGLRVLADPGQASTELFAKALSGGIGGETRDRVVARTLELATSSTNDNVVQGALEVLKALGGRNEAAAVARIANDPNRAATVREVARRAADVLALR